MPFDLKTPSVNFVNIESGMVRNIFIRVWTRYTALSQNPVTLRKIRLSTSTMRAQPILNKFLWFSKKRHYRVDMAFVSKIDTAINVEDMPEEVLEGWFAHEIGHIMDYSTRSAFNLIRFGLAYLLLDHYRKGAERKADEYAIQHGFAQHLIATKRFILDHSDLSPKYKKQIQKYYLGPDEIEQLIIQDANDPTDL